MKAVIMAGGKGTRLRPLTSNLPKPMVPLLGRPCMEYIIDLLKKHGITEIAVTLQYLPKAIKNYFGDGSEFGVNIVYFDETAPLGTAGSVKNCEEFLDERFIVISGDALTDFNLQKAMDFHETSEATATIVLHEVENPLEYGVVMTDEGGRIIRFLEKPTWSEVFSDTVNTGIYILEPSVLTKFERNVEFDFSKDLFPILLSEGSKMSGYIADGYWSDIGSLEAYRQTQFDMLDGKVKIEIKAQQAGPGIFVEEDVKIEELANVHSPAFIGRGTYIEKGSQLGRYTILGKHNMVKEGAVLCRTIVWDHNYLGLKTELNGVTVCRRSFIEDGSQLSEGVIMGDGCRIGANSHIKPGVKIWPDKDVDANSTVHTSIIWGARAAKSLFGAYGIKGIPNIDITPDFATRLASAMATVFKTGGTVGLSACSHPFSQLIKLSMMTGLHASGVHTMDFGSTIPAATRFGIRVNQVDGGIHISTDEGKDAFTTIEVFDHLGIPISKSIERKIENSYWQEDFVRETVTKLGNNRFNPTVAEDYIAALKREIIADKVSSSRFTLVLDYNSMVLGSMALSLLSSLGCKIIQIRSAIQEDLTELIEAVKKNRADLGIRLDQDARNYTFVTDEGKVISKDLTIALHLLIHSHSSMTAPFRLGIPVSAPGEIEFLAQKLGTKVIRTKESPREMMEVAREQKFQPLFDGLYSMVKVIGFLSENGRVLSQTLRGLPSFHMARQAVFCDWKNKGKVMRMMMEETKGKQVELLDGIKVYDTDGWVLIMPDIELPHFRVITQGASKEIASSLAQNYVEKIQKYQMI